MDGNGGGRSVQEAMAVTQIRSDKHGLNYGNKKGRNEQI